MINLLIRFLILFCLILETHSWDWDNYPSPREATYWKCGVTKPAYVCDPDGMLTDHQREVIVEIVEDFKEKTKRVRGLFKFYFPGNFNFIAKFINSLYKRRTQTCCSLIKSSNWFWW